jgi:feruloyl esterase
MQRTKRSRCGSGGRPAAIGAALALGLVAAHGTAHAALNCASLTTVTPDASTITSAAIVTPPATIGGAAVTVPLCRVQGVARPSFDSEIKFEVWLPPTAADWTGRMKGNGTGGYAGATPYGNLARDIGDGFVTAGSNMGHDGGENASWTLGHPEKVKDWGLRAHYFVATAAKTLSQAFYDKPVSHSYFEGCSNGGRQAMMMAQNHRAFDRRRRAVAVVPRPADVAAVDRQTLTSAPFSPPSISVAKRGGLRSALQACDANDGLVDGQITNPRACTFDIDTMGPSATARSPRTVIVAKRMYGGTHRNWDDLTWSSATQEEVRFRGRLVAAVRDNGLRPFISHYVYR